MLTNAFVKHFDRFILTSYLRIPEINLADGIRWFTPIPQKTGAYVFLGDAKAFFRLLTDHSLIAGSTYLVCNGEEPCPAMLAQFNMELNIIILNMSLQDAIQHLNMLNTTSSSENPEGEQVLTAFFKMISVQNIATSEAMASWAARFPYPLKTFIACIVIHSEQTLHKPAYVHTVSKVLRNFFPQTNLFYHNQEWIIFYSQEEQSSDDLLINYEDFSKLLKEHSLFAGISYVGVLPENMYTLYLTARDSMNLGIKISIQPKVKRIYSFSQYHMLYLIHLCAPEYDRLHNHCAFYYMAHPDVVRIFLYDQEHGSDLLDTLYAYLINHSNLSKTAQFLYMHRNTVYNKLMKIEKLLGYHLSDIHYQATFVLSYMLVKYYCDYQRNELV